MKQGEQYVIQGTASTFTYVNLGNEVITVEGSNDNDIWDEIIQVAPKDSEVKVHSFKFLKCTGGVLAVSRGVGGGESQPTEGGSKVEIQDLDLDIYALRVTSHLKFTPDVQPNLIGTDINGLAIGSELSAYFKIELGSFQFTLDQTRPTAVFVLRETEPTEICYLDQIADEIFIAAMYMMGKVNIVINQSVMGQPLFNTTVDASAPLEALAVKITNRTIDIYNKNVLIGSYTHGSDFGRYVQTAIFPQAIIFNELAFDLSNAFESLDYVVPNHVKEGVFYHLKKDAVLLGKELKANDFISFFDNKSDMMIIRTGGDQQVPEIPVSKEYFRGFHESIELLAASVTNPKYGDYALIRNYSVSTGMDNVTLCFYSDLGAEWKPVLSKPAFKGVYPYAPYIADAQAGDYIVIGYDENMQFAFYHPYLSMFVEVKPKNTDSILEGNTNQFYTDFKVVNLLVNLFLTEFSAYPSAKGYFDNYINTLLNSDYFAQNNKIFAKKATVGVTALAKVENLDFKLENMKRTVNQLTYQSMPNGFISPTNAVANDAYDLFEFDPFPFLLYNGFWYISFEVSCYAEQSARLQVGVMFDGGESLANADLHYADLKYTEASASLETIFYANNNAAFTNNQPMRFSIGYKKGTTYMIDSDGKWKGLGNVQSQPYAHNNVKFFIRKFYGTGISIRNIHASFGEIFQLPSDN